MSQPNARKENQEEVRVTIILTNYNHAKYLTTSLDGIVGQSREADEIIVIDDGSTDESLKLIESYARNHSNIRVLENGKNRGVQYSISRALGAATGNWIVWAAADDKLLPDFLAKGISAIQENPDIGMVFSQLATFRDDTGEERHYTGREPNQDAFYIGDKPTVFTPEGLMERLSQGYLWISGNTAIVRKDFLFSVGAFSPALEWHADWFAFYAVALRYGACGIPETLAMMRVVPDTYSSSGMADPKKQALVMQAVLELLRRPSFSDLRRKFRARPCLFSPFPIPMIKALIRRPEDWALLVRMLTWAFERRKSEYSRRAARKSFSSLGGVKARVLYLGLNAVLFALERSTPDRWKTDASLSSVIK